MKTRRPYWQSNSKSKTHFIEIDLGKEYKLKGFSYTPQTNNSEGMIEQGIFKVSDNGKFWGVVEGFKFGNLINNPVPRIHYFKKSITTRYVRIESKIIAGGDRSATIGELDFFE